MFELKGRFLKELRENTFRGSKDENANEHIERVLEIVDLLTTPEVTQDQLMLCVFPISLLGATSRWLRNEPAGSITTWEILKGKFLSKYCPPSRTAKRMEEINNFQQEAVETLYQAWERFKKLLLRCPQHYLTNMQEVILFYKGLDVPTRQILDSKGVVHKMSAADAKKAIQEMANHSQKWHDGTSTRNKSRNTFDGLAVIQAQLNNLAADPGFYRRDNGNPSYQERRQMVEETLSKFMAESAKRHEEHSSLIKEIRASTDVAIRNQGASIKALEIQIGKMIKRDDKTSLIKLSRANIPFPGRLKVYGYDEKEVLREFEMLQEKDPWSFTLPCTINNLRFDKALADLGASVSVMPYSTFTNLDLGKLAPTRLIIKLVDRNVKRPKGLAENVLVGIDKFVFLVDFIVLDMPEDTKIQLILRIPFLSTVHAQINVFKQKIALKVRNDKIVFKSDSPTSNIIKRVYVLGLRERMELDLEARLMGEALILNRLEDPEFRDFIELNDLNEPLELRNHEIEDLGPTIEEGEVIHEPKVDIVQTRDDDIIVENID
ncbi:two-component response regulator-like APRR2 isoform X1 [Tanacetum coccineum]